MDFDLIKAYCIVGRINCRMKKTGTKVQWLELLFELRLVKLHVLGRCDDRAGKCYYIASVTAVVYTEGPGQHVATHALPRCTYTKINK